MRPLSKALIVAAVAVSVASVIGVKSYARGRAANPYGDFDPAAPVPLEPVPASYEPSTPGKPRLAALGAGACIPCKAMAPIRAELRREFAGVLAVDFHDVWKDPEAGQHFGIWMIPTLIFYDASGRELGRRGGVILKDDILAAFDGWGIHLRPTGTR